jgi:AhpD family alkylhydroperoxidase
MGHGREVLDELQSPTRSLRQAIPETWAGFAQMHNTAMAPGGLPGHIKELLAVAIAVSKQCDGCIAAHLRGAVAKGASAAEVAETIGVVMLMNGGPATVYGPRAWAAYEEFAAAAAAKTS